MDNESIRDYKQAKSQIEVMDTLTFGAELNVLLITDRLHGCAIGLQEYLQNSTDVTVDLVNTLEAANKIINEKPIDFLIFVGYQQNDDNYRAKETYERLNRYSPVVIYAGLTLVISSVCNLYNIACKYDRFEPIEGFITYLHRLYDEASARLHRDFPDGTAREQVWSDTFNSIQRAEQEAAQKREEQRIMEQKMKRRNEILGYFGIAVLILAVVCLGVWGEVPPTNDIVDSAEYRYVMEGRDEVLTITALADDELVSIALYRSLAADEENALLVMESSLSVDESVKLGLIYRKFGSLIMFPSPRQGYSFSSGKLMTYCLIELSASEPRE